MSTTNYHVLKADFTDQRVVDLLRLHSDFCRDPSNSTVNGIQYVLDFTSLQAPDITLWTIWDSSQEQILGCIALKTLTSGPRISSPSGELKSMHVVAAARGTGVADTLLRHAISEARWMGLEKLFLETGTTEAFSRARGFYARHGFVGCGVFGDYVEGDNNTFMMRELKGE